MWTRNVLIVAAAGALAATPLLAQQKTAAPRTVATAVRDTVQTRRVAHRAASVPSTKADTTTKSHKSASAATATTKTAHAKHSRKHTAKHGTKSGAKSSTKSDTTGTRKPSSAKP